MGIPVQKVRYTHDAVIDCVIANPAVSQREMAQVFGYTESWLSTVMNSDAFLERLAQRKREMVDPGILASVDEKFRNLADRSLKVLLAKLENPNVASISDKTVISALSVSAKALSIGGFAPASSVTVQTADPERLNRLADRLNAFLGPRAPAADVTVIEDVSSPGPRPASDTSLISAQGAASDNPEVNLSPQPSDHSQEPPAPFGVVVREV